MIDLISEIYYLPDSVDPKALYWSLFGGKGKLEGPPVMKKRGVSFIVTAILCQNWLRDRS